MDYNFMVRFKPNEKDVIWKYIKELKVDADQVAIDSEGFEYIGWNVYEMIDELKKEKEVKNG